MQRKSKNGKILRLAVFSLLLCLLSGMFVACAPKEKRPTVEEEPMVAFPQGAILLASVNFEEQRTPEAVKEYENVLSTNPYVKEQIEKIKETTGLDLYKDIDRIALALYEAKEEEGKKGVKLLLIGKGKFNEEQLITAIKKNIPAKLETAKFRNVNYYFGSFEESEGFLAFPPPHFAVAGTNKKLFEESLERFENPLASALEDVALKELLKSVDRKSPLWLAGKVPSGSLDEIAKGEGCKFLKGISGYYFYSKEKPDKSSYIELGAICLTAADAEEVKKGFQDFLTKAKGFLMFIPGGEALTMIVDKALVSAEEKKTKVVIELTEEEVADLRKKLEEMQRQFQQVLPTTPQK